MSALQLSRHECLINGEPVRLVYDEEADMLDIFFGENARATGIELTENILLRIVPESGRAVSLTLLHFSILTERTEYGPRSYPLNTLKTFSLEMQERVIRILTTAPVNQFLKVSYFQASPVKRIPFTYVESPRFAAAA